MVLERAAAGRALLEVERVTASEGEGPDRAGQIVDISVAVADEQHFFWCSAPRRSARLR